MRAEASPGGLFGEAVFEVWPDGRWDVEALIKRRLPTFLFGRSLLIIILPSRSCRSR